MRRNQKKQNNLQHIGNALDHDKNTQNETALNESGSGDELSRNLPYRRTTGNITKTKIII